MIKRILFLAILGILFSSVNSFAQVTATASSKFAWDIGAPDLATANSYTYKYYPDGSVSGALLTGIVCTGAASPFSCIAPIPVFTAGSHVVVMSAINSAGESLKSVPPYAFTFVTPPNSPVNFHVVP